MSEIETKAKKKHRASVRWNGRRFYKTFTRKADADRWRLSLQVKKERGEFPDVFEESPLLLGDFAEHWINQRQALGKPESSLGNERTRLRLYVIPEFGHLRLSAIATAEWESFLNNLVSKNGLSPATRNRIRSMMSRMYEDAIRGSQARYNPIRIIPKAREASSRKRILSEDEVLRYLREAQREPYWYQVFVLIALNTGARIGEIIGLQWSDIDLLNDRLSISRTYEDATCSVQERTKGKKERILGINSELKKILSEYQKYQRTTWLFWNKEHQSHTTPSHIRKIHKKVCERANIQGAVIHDFRRTYGSYYVMRGGSAYELKELLGHSSIQTTEIYARLSPEYLRSKASVVSFSLPKITAENVVKFEIPKMGGAQMVHETLLNTTLSKG